MPRGVDANQFQYAMAINCYNKTFTIVNAVPPGGAFYNRDIISRMANDFLRDNREESVIKEKQNTVITVLFNGKPFIFGFSESTPLDARKTPCRYDTAYALLRIKEAHGLNQTEIEIIGFYYDESSAVTACNYLSKNEKKNVAIYKHFNDEHNLYK